MKGTIDLKFKRSDTSKKWFIHSLDLKKSLKIAEGDSLFKLGIDSYIKTLSSFSKEDKKRIIDLSTKYNVKSRFTSFFAADKLEDNTLKKCNPDDFTIHLQFVDGKQKLITLKNREGAHFPLLKKGM